MQEPFSREKERNDHLICCCCFFFFADAAEHGARLQSYMHLWQFKSINICGICDANDAHHFFFLWIRFFFVSLLLLLLKLCGNFSIVICSDTSFIHSISLCVLVWVVICARRIDINLDLCCKKWTHLVVSIHDVAITTKSRRARKKDDASQMFNRNKCFTKIKSHVQLFLKVGMRSHFTPTTMMTMKKNGQWKRSWSMHVAILEKKKYNNKCKGIRCARDTQ